MTISILLLVFLGVAEQKYPRSYNNIQTFTTNLDRIRNAELVKTQCKLFSNIVYINGINLEYSICCSKLFFIQINDLNRKVNKSIARPS